jgi:hypothetical protein
VRWLLVRSPRASVLLGIVSIIMFIVYGVFVYTIAPPTVVKPWGYCILPGVCDRLTVGDVEYMATYVIYTSVPLIGTNMILSWFYKDKENPKVSANAYGDGLIFFLIGNAILFTGAFFEGLMWSQTPLIDYLLYAVALATGVLHFITMRWYFLEKARQSY